MDKKLVLATIEAYFSSEDLVDLPDYEMPKLEDYKFENVENFGGEGQGDHAHVVFSVKHGNKEMFVKVDGYYDSYNGISWDDSPYEVEPYEKTITAWRKVKKSK